MNEEILYYGAIASLLELGFWAVVGALALRRYRKRKATSAVMIGKEKWVTTYPPATLAEDVNWQTRLKDWYKQGEEE
tara:strand:+ start:1983 stop:2213 length:231 start_codon:yes stop_codon:yes gene_type:complete